MTTKLKFFALFECLLVLSVSFAICYFISESDKSLGKNEEIVKKEESKLEKILELFVRIVFDDSNLVSALESPIISTCLISKNGSICQEYSSQDCDQQCTQACLPLSRSNVNQCKIGTCLDKNTGLCQIKSPMQACNANAEALWFSDQNGNVPACKKGCCVIGQNAIFTTSGACELEAEENGLNATFREEINQELSCLALAGSDEQGACVFLAQPINDCKLLTKKECFAQKGSFHSGFLCSSPELNTKCEKQKSVSCAPENERTTRDELYWYDSCGNRENIYDANTALSFNDGKILSKEDSCQLGIIGNSLSNQKTCGNCNRLLGSICGAKTNNEKLADSVHDVVCRDLSCKDNEGKKRENGESWCTYQGSIGVDKGTSTERSSDSVGSQHFRQSCINGEVITEPCYDFRKGICVESKNQIPQGGTFSTASCRINRGMECYGYNEESKKQMCEKNPDCFIKKVDVSSSFSFDFCVPKYKPGSVLGDEGDLEERICSMGTQTCKYIKIKSIGGKKEVNKECTTEKFTQQMNDFCMSLGDCGASVNYLGEVSEGYKVNNAPKLSEGYLKDIARYADEKLFRGKIAPVGNLDEYYASLGIPPGLGSASLNSAGGDAAVSGLNMPAGAIGILLPMLAKTAIGAKALSSVGLANALPAKGFIGPSLKPGLSGFGGALAGAAVGVAVVGMLLQFTGVGKGLSPAIAYSMLAVGAFSGAVIGANVLGGASWATGALLTTAIVALVVVIVVIIIFAILGIGKKKEIDVTFTCLPWQPPAGKAACEKCGSDGLPCSEYACRSIGQGCELINADDPKETKCIYVGKDDVSSPLIKPMKGVLPANYSYTEIDFGMRIKSNALDGCISETYSVIPIGISLDEAGQCKFSTAPLTSFDNMQDYFGGRNRFLLNHTSPLSIPSLESLGVSPFDYKAQMNASLYVRCQDKSANKNERDFVIQFCIKQGPDITPPAIINREPTLETIRNDATVINAIAFVNEPSECKWSLQDQEYSLMENDMECGTELEDQTINGFACKTNFSVENKNESKFFIRCLDQPWLIGENATKRNPSKNSYVFNLKKTLTPLKIDSITPNNQTLIFGSSPATINVEVKTSGGYDSTATCSFKTNNGLQPLFETFSSVHKQTFNQLIEGQFTYTIFCQDVIGNIVEQNASVLIDLDGDVPKISRAYKTKEQITLVTDEKSTCVYGTDRKKECAFEFWNGTLLEKNSYVHTFSFDAGKTYFVKCQDSFGNGNLSQSCGIVLQGNL